MYVTLLFDVEDLVDPRSDDVVMRVAQIFAEENVPATMMIVGEKVRLWERRGRWDVIEAIRHHDVGLHTNRHSVHPTVAEYLEGKGWEDGIEEVVAREASGLADMERILDKTPSCWGRGGSTWGPQVAPALSRMGIPADVYSFTHLGSRQQDVHFFCGTLCYYWYYGGFDASFSDDAAFDESWGQAQEHIHGCVQEGVPWLGLFVCHPAMVRAKQFWDYLNFNRGQNTPPKQYRLPEYRNEAQWETAQRNLRRLARDIARLPGVQVLTVQQVNQRVEPPAKLVQGNDLLQRARAAVRRPSIETDDPLVSPAEALYLWALWLHAGEPEEPLPHQYVEGPIEEPSQLSAPAQLSSEALKLAAGQVCNAVQTTGRLPASVRLGQLDVGVGTIYRALAAARVNRSIGDFVLEPGPEVPAIGDVLQREVLDNVPGWMHKPDLDVSAHAQFTRLQSWTLRPARLR